MPFPKTVTGSEAPPHNDPPYPLWSWDEAEAFLSEVSGYPGRRNMRPSVHVSLDNLASEIVDAAAHGRQNSLPTPYKIALTLAYAAKIIRDHENGK